MGVAWELIQICWFFNPPKCEYHKMFRTKLSGLLEWRCIQFLIITMKSVCLAKVSFLDICQYTSLTQWTLINLSRYNNISCLWKSFRPLPQFCSTKWKHKFYKQDMSGNVEYTNNNLCIVHVMEWLYLTFIWHHDCFISKP